MLFCEILEGIDRPNPYDDSVWYRGTNHPGNLRAGNGRNGDMLGRGIYLTNSPDYAAKFGTHVEEYQVLLSSVLVDSDPRVNGLSGVPLNDFARQHGYDAIMASVGAGIWQLCVFRVDDINAFEGW